MPHSSQWNCFLLVSSSCFWFGLVGVFGDDDEDDGDGDEEEEEECVRAWVLLLLLLLLLLPLLRLLLLLALSGARARRHTRQRQPAARTEKVARRARVAPERDAARRARRRDGLARVAQRAHDLGHGLAVERVALVEVLVCGFFVLRVCLCCGCEPPCPSLHLY